LSICRVPESLLLQAPAAYGARKRLPRVGDADRPKAAGVVACGRERRGRAFGTGVRTSRARVIDGVIGEPEWAGATRFENFIQFEPQNGHRRG